MVINFTIIINTCLLALHYCRQNIFHNAKIFFNPLKYKTLNISKQGKYDLYHFQNQGLIYGFSVKSIKNCRQSLIFKVPLYQAKQIISYSVIIKKNNDQEKSEYCALYHDAIIYNLIYNILLHHALYKVCLCRIHK